MTADEVTDQHANKELILVCLRFLQTIGKKVIVQESFLDSNHMSSRATGKNVAEHIINILKNHEINISNCRGQAYDGAVILKVDNFISKKLDRMLHTLKAEITC